MCTLQVSENGLQCEKCRKGTYDVSGGKCLECPAGAQCEGSKVETVTPDSFVVLSVSCLPFILNLFSAGCRDSVMQIQRATRTNDISNNKCLCSGRFLVRPPCLTALSDIAKQASPSVQQEERALFAGFAKMTTCESSIFI